MTALEKKPTALIVDWGGVLTNGLDHMLTNWTGQENIDLDVYYKVFNEWLGPEVEKELRINNKIQDENTDKIQDENFTDKIQDENFTDILKSN